MRVLWWLHRAIHRVTGGRLGTSQAGEDRLGTLFLRTIGRRTGEARETALFYLADGPDIVVVASNAGADRDPAWWRNLQAEPDAEVEIARRRRPVRARLALGPERERLWARIVAVSDDYAAYEDATDRPIPVVLLEPR
jgi:deazaflavin-dependent oxidoreductase (nitroreductase family)